mmetsp:Transcript_93855/g.162491  ORF Transcript_93855/g.162491 Transcript_93855/m.162491 type:complete len:187 (-) Transcript_93855:606-1166(-)
MIGVVPNMIGVVPSMVRVVPRTVDQIKWSVQGASIGYKEVNILGAGGWAGASWLCLVPLMITTAPARQEGKEDPLKSWPLIFKAEHDFQEVVDNRSPRRTCEISQPVQPLHWPGEDPQSDQRRPKGTCRIERPSRNRSSNHGQIAEGKANGDASKLGLARAVDDDSGVPFVASAPICPNLVLNGFL